MSQLTEQQRARLMSLATAMQKAVDLRDASATMNVPSDPRERLNQLTRYHMICAEANIAIGRYTEFVNAVTKLAIDRDKSFNNPQE